MKKTLVVSKKTHERLRKYKNTVSAGKDHDLSFEEAIVELLDKTE